MIYIKDGFGLIWFKIHLGFKYSMTVKVSLQTFKQIRILAQIRFSSMNSKEDKLFFFIYFKYILQHINNEYKV